MEELKTLVTRAAEGDVEAFGLIVRRFQDMAYGYAYSLLGDFHLAQDVAQEAFVQAYRSLPDLREPAAFPGWFRRILLKYCDRTTRGKHLRTVPLETVEGAVAGGPDPAEAAARAELEEKVLGAVRGLPDLHREATTLFYIDGYSQGEIAEFLEVPVTTVKKRLHDARQKLKGRMMEMVDETLKSHALPEEFADLVVRRAASEDDLKEAAGLLSYGPRKRGDSFSSPEKAEEAGIYVVGPEGKVEGAGYFNEDRICIGRTVVRTVRPAEMGAEARGVPDPTFVRSFNACFKMARERGIHVSAVHGSMFDHAFCGFVPCFYYPVATLPANRARAVESQAGLIEAKGRQKEDAEEAWLRDPYGPKMTAYIGGGIPHLVRQNEEIAGYVSINSDYRKTDHCGMPFGHVTWVTVRTREGALAVLRRAGELVDEAGETEICLMQSHKTLIVQAMLSLGGKYLLRPSCDVAGLDAEMVAIIDLHGLTRELAEDFQERLGHSGVGDAGARFSIETAGMTVGFLAEGGGLDIVAEKQKVHRVLPRWVVTRLYMGYYSGDDVLAMGSLPCDRSDGKTPDDPDLDMQPLLLPENEARLFQELFPKMWPVSWPDPDVWPWVIGEEHPAYQNESRKTPEQRAAIDALRFPWIGY